MAMSPADVEALATQILASHSLGPYAVFSLPPTAGQNKFKARYRELAKALHPDKAKSAIAESAFKAVTEAFRAVESGFGRPNSVHDECGASVTREPGQATRAPFWKVTAEHEEKPQRWSSAGTKNEREKKEKTTHREVPKWRGPGADSTGGWVGGGVPAPFMRDTANVPRDPRNVNATRKETEEPDVPSAHPEFVTLDVHELDDVYDDDDDVFGETQINQAWFADDARVTKSKEEARRGVTKPHTDLGRWENNGTKSVEAQRYVAPTRRDENEGDAIDPHDGRGYDDDLTDEVEVVFDEFSVETAATNQRAWSAKPGTVSTSGKWGGDQTVAASLHPPPRRRDDAAVGAPPVPRSGRDVNTTEVAFELNEIGDPSELEREAYAGEENIENGNATTAKPEKETKSKPKPKRKRKATHDPHAVPLPRLTILDEPRVPHTKLPKKKFAQATLAFG